MKTTESSLQEPAYELRKRIPKSASRWELELWQLPSPATPRLLAPVQLARLRGQPLSVLERRLLKSLARWGIRPGTASEKSWPLSEEQALGLGLLFRTAAPMRNAEKIFAVADGVEVMSREEAGYWLGMVMQRPNPRRVLAALRMLLS